MKVHFAVGMDRNEKIYEIADHARVAEESGFRHITVGDVQNCTRDLYVKMAMCATSTHRVTIGSGVVAPYTRHAVVTASAHAPSTSSRACRGGGEGGRARRTRQVRARGTGTHPVGR